MGDLTAVQYALLSAVSVAVFWMISRAFLKKEKDSDLFAFLMQALTIPVWIPLIFLESPRVPEAFFGWAILLVAGVLWSIQQVWVFQSLRLVAVSVREPVYHTKLLWASMAGILFLGETLTVSKAAGVAFLMGALFLIRRGKNTEEIKGGGTRLVLASAFVAGLAYVADKAALGFFSPALYAVLVTVVTTCILGADLLHRKRASNFLPYVKRHAPPLALAALVGGISYWFLVKALSLGAVSLVVPLLELGLVFTVVGGMIFLNERESPGTKLAAAGLALIGAWLLA